jgi:hypothetical protein
MGFLCPGDFDMGILVGEQIEQMMMAINARNF